MLESYSTGFSRTSFRDLSGKEEAVERSHMHGSKAVMRVHSSMQSVRMNHDIVFLMENKMLESEMQSLAANFW
jgi:hypothetical protein